MDQWLRRRQAAGSLTAFHFIRRGYQRLVLLVDGLDESMTLGKRKAEDNPIPKIFPLEVPPQVFVVAASRPEYPHLGWFDRRAASAEHVDLDALSESNERAVREHWTVLGAAMTPALNEALLKAAIEGAQAIRASMRRRSSGRGSSRTRGRETASCWPCAGDRCRDVDFSAECGRPTRSRRYDERTTLGDGSARVGG